MPRYSDPIDEACAEQERAIQNAIDNSRNTGPKITPIGECHWCTEPMTDAKLFCDMDCEHDFTRYNKNRS
jgi:hypothetical protein